MRVVGSIPLPFDLRWLPLLVLGLVVITWAPMLLFTGRWSGWRRLAGLYPNRNTGKAPSFRCSPVLMGMTNYRSGARLTADESHLHFAMSAILRPGHRPFSVPWSEVTVSRDEWPWFPLKGHPMVRLTLAQHGDLRILVPAKGGERIAAASGGRLTLGTLAAPMTKLARAAGFAAALMLVAAPRSEAQSSSIRVTIAGGPHAGSYELKRDQCDALDGQIISMFTPEKPAGAGSSAPESIELYTEPGKGKPDGFAVRVDFRSKAGQRIAYEIYAIPPELQAPGRAKPPRGRGSVTIRQEKTGTVAEFRGETKDGVLMHGSVDCRKR